MRQREEEPREKEGEMRESRRSMRRQRGRKGVCERERGEEIRLIMCTMQDIQ